MSEQIRYTHLGDADGKYGTVAVIWDGEWRHVGVALCSSKDQFSRKKGRLISGGRARLAMERSSRAEGMSFLWNDPKLEEWLEQSYLPVPDSLYKPKPGKPIEVRQ
jgi:hypothetical protein